MHYFTQISRTSFREICLRLKYLCDKDPLNSNLRKSFLLIYNAYFQRKHCCFIYRCATATLPLRNSKVDVAQQQPYRPAAVNNFAVISVTFYTFVLHRGRVKDEYRVLSLRAIRENVADMENCTRCPPSSVLYSVCYMLLADGGR